MGSFWMKLINPFASWTEDNDSLDWKNENIQKWILWITIWIESWKKIGKMIKLKQCSGCVSICCGWIQPAIRNQLPEVSSSRAFSFIQKNSRRTSFSVKSSLSKSSRSQHEDVWAFCSRFSPKSINQFYRSNKNCINICINNNKY